MATMNIQGMTCAHCVMHVKQALLTVPGVEGVEVDLGAGRAVVVGEAESEALVAAVEAEGYSAQVI